MQSSLSWFPALCWSAIPTSCYNVVFPYVTFLTADASVEVCHLSQSSKSVLTGLLRRCMQYWLRNHCPRICSNTKSTIDDKDSPISIHTNHISNSAILSNNCFIEFFMCMCTGEENGIANEAIVLQWPVWSTTQDFKVVKKQWAGTLLRIKRCCFVRKWLWKSH